MSHGQMGAVTFSNLHTHNTLLFFLSGETVFPHEPVNGCTSAFVYDLSHSQEQPNWSHKVKSADSEIWHRLLLSSSEFILHSLKIINVWIVEKK